MEGVGEARIDMEETVAKCQHMSRSGVENPQVRDNWLKKSTVCGMQTYGEKKPNDTGAEGTSIEKGETEASLSKDPWRQYRRGAGAWASILNATAGRADGRYPLEAGLTGHILTIIAVNGAILTAFDPTRRAGLVGISIAAFGAWRNRSGLAALRRAKRTTKKERGLRLLSWNVEHHNSPENVAKGVASAGADITILFEPLSAQTEAAKAALGKAVSCEMPGDGDARHAGIACYAGEGGETTRSDVGGMPAIRCLAKDPNGNKIAVWGYRPEAPTGEDRQRRWVEQLDALAVALQEETEPIVLMGDLNSCVWHQPFSEVVSKLGLRRASPMIGGTWRHELLGWRGRIDHIYVDERISVVRTKRGSAWGSDHRQLVCEVLVES